MDSKQAPPPSYGEAVGAPTLGTQNEGFVPPAGDYVGYTATPGTAAPTYLPQAGYPEGYSHPAGAGYGQPNPGAAPGYGLPPAQGYVGGGYGVQQTVVVNQPVGGTGMVVHAVPDHMGLAVFACLCCCWPLGLVAISKAGESRRALEQGDLRSASQYSLEARRYSMWAIAGGIVCVIIVIIIAVIRTTYTVY